MAADIDTLTLRYFDSCKRFGILPNEAVLSSLFKSKVYRVHCKVASLVVVLDDLKDVDYQPLLDLLKEIDFSEIDAVDLINRASCALSGENVLSLLRAVHRKLRVVDIQDILFGKDFLLASLTSFREDCFTCMPNLKYLSLCETRITNLWTTSAALAKLPSLTELRFQNCFRWDDKGSCSISCGRKSKGKDDSGLLDGKLHSEGRYSNDEEITDQISNVEMENFDTYDMNFYRSTLEYSSDDSEVDFSSRHQDFSLVEFLPDVPQRWDELMHNQNPVGRWEIHDEEEFFPSLRNSGLMPCFVQRNPISCHSSPICYEKYYREYIITTLPNLKILDNLSIEMVDRDRAKFIFSQHFEYLPYRKKTKESVVSILHKREIRASHTRMNTTRETPSFAARNSKSFYLRSLSAAKMGSSVWPALHPLSLLGCVSRDERRSFRPRQFEYHPSDSSLMVFGTLDGEVVVVNHENGKIVSYIPSLGAMNNVLGLCWLRKYPSKLIAGSDNGSLRLYDINHVPSATRGGPYQSSGSVIFDDFDQLTSVHVNSTDELFVASGYSKHVALYDISSGRCLQVFTDMHREHINVVKFANHSPSIFATSSFDKDVKMWDLRQKPFQPCYTATSSRGNVMVCFSPDDQYLLVSAVDNEVKQLLAVDGRLHQDFGITSTGSSQNYTRSYYMNGRDYVISGSCDEHVVRICCAQTGRRLRDISLEGKGSDASMFVQSLRGDPFRDFNFSVLAAYIRPSSNSEIVKVNLLSSIEHEKVHSHSQSSRRSNGLGG